MLTPELRALIDETNEISSRIEGFQANVCLNYGGRDEILHAARAFARDCAAGEQNIDGLTEESFSHYLYSDGLPDPDLLIRPGGEKRISNYLCGSARTVSSTSATRSGPTSPRKNSTRRSLRISSASGALAD